MPPRYRGQMRVWRGGRTGGTLFRGLPPGPNVMGAAGIGALPPYRPQLPSRPASPQARINLANRWPSEARFVNIQPQHLNQPKRLPPFTNLPPRLPGTPLFPQPEQTGSNLGYRFGRFRVQPTYKPTYWENPLHIARAYQQYQAAKPGDEIPEWYDPEKFEQAYQYLEATNKGEPWYNWLWPAENDPFRQYAQQLPSPDPKYGMAPMQYQRWLTNELASRDPQTWTNEELQDLDPGTKDIFLEQRRRLAEIGAPAAPMATPEIPWEDMPTWQKIALNPSPEAQGAFSMMPFSLAGGVGGFLSGGPLGGLIGFGAPMGVGSILGGLSKKYPAAAQLMMYLDYPAEWLEQAIGVGMQAAMTTNDPEAYGTFEQFLKELPQAWQAGHIAATSGAELGGDIPFRQAAERYAYPVMQYGSAWGLGPIGLMSTAAGRYIQGQARPYIDDFFSKLYGFDVNAPTGRLDAANILPLINLAAAQLAAGVGNQGLEKWGEEELKKIRFAGPNQVFMPDTPIPQDVPVTGILAMAQLRRELVNNPQADPNEILAKWYEMFGLSGTLSELGAHVIMDPLNIAPMAAAKGTGKIARIAGNIPMANAFDDAVGPIQGWKKYRNAIRTGKAGAATELSAFERFVGGLNEQGQVRTLAGETPRNPILRSIQHLADLTPGARARLAISHLADNISALLGLRKGDPEGQIKLVHQAAELPPTEAARTAAFMGGPEMYSFQTPLRSALPKLDTMLELYKDADRQRQLLYKLIDVIGDPKKKLGERGAEILKLLRSSDDAETVFQLLKDRVDVVNPELVRALRADPLFNAEGIASMMEVFKKGGVPWHPDEFSAHVWGTINDEAAKWATEAYGVSPDAPVYRFFNVLKQAQSFVLLGFNPAYLVNNEIGNIVGRAATGVWGYMPESTIRNFMERFGYEPFRYQAGVGMSALVPEERIHRAETPEGVVGAPIGKYGETGEEVLRKAEFEGKGMLNTLNRGTRKLNRLGVVSQGSRHLEVLEGMQTWYRALSNWMSSNFRRGKGFRTMDNGLVEMLRRIGSSDTDIYRAIESSLNPEEYRQKIFGAPTKYDFDTALAEVARKMNLDPGMVENTLAELRDILKGDVKNATLPDNVRQIFNALEEHIQNHFDDLLTQDLEARARQIETQTAAGGFVEGLRLWEEMHWMTEEYWMRHFDEWEHTFELQRLMKEQGASSDAINVLFRKRSADAARQWKRVRKFEKTTSKAILEGLGTDDAGVESYGNLLDDVGRERETFFKEKERRIKKHFQDTKDLPYEERQAAWNVLESELNDLKKQNDTRVAEIQHTVDEMFITLTTQQFGENVGSTARWWRERMAAMRADGERMVADFRDTLVGQDAAFRRLAWTKFLEEDYRPFIRDFLREADAGAIELYRTAMGNPPPDGAPPADPQPMPPPREPPPGAPGGIPADPEGAAALQRYDEYLNRLYPEDENGRIGEAADMMIAITDAIETGELRIPLTGDEAVDAATWKAYQDLARSMGFDLEDMQVVTRPAEEIAAELPQAVGRIPGQLESLREMTREEFLAELEAVRQYEKNTLIDLFGEKGAKKWEKLERKSNSLTDPDGADKAYEELQKMEANLTPEQIRRLYGEDEPGYSYEQLASIKDAFDIIDDLSDAQLIDRVASNIYKITPDEARNIGGLDLEKQANFIRVREALRVLGERGISADEIMGNVARRLSQDVEPADVEFLLREWIEEAAAPPEAVAPPERVLPPETVQRLTDYGLTPDEIEAVRAGTMTPERMEEVISRVTQPTAAAPEGPGANVPGRGVAPGAVGGPATGVTGAPGTRVRAPVAPGDEGIPEYLRSVVRPDITYEIKNPKVKEILREDIGQQTDLRRIFSNYDRGNRAYLLANGTGTGKTYVGMGVIAESGAKNVLVVMPSRNIFGEWEGAAKLYGLKVDTGTMPPDQGIHLTTYAAVGKNPGKYLGRKYDFIIMDESHRMKGEGSWGRGAQAVLDDNPNTKVLFQSATPFQSAGQMEYLKYLGLWDANDRFGFDNFLQDHHYTFVKPSVGPGYWRFDGTVDDILDIYRQINERGIGSTRNLVIDQNLDNSFIRVPLDPYYRNLYANAEDAFETAGRLVRGPRKAMVRAQRTIALRRILEMSKIDQTIQIAKRMQAEGRQVAIFTGFKGDLKAPEFKSYRMRHVNEILADFYSQMAAEEGRTVQRIVNELGGPDVVAVVTGGVADRMKQLEINNYQTGRKKVLVATAASGGTGLSLHDLKGNAPRAQINMYLPWSGQDFQQVAGRSYRYGTASPVKQFWLFGDAPKEAQIAQVVGGRLQEMGGLVRGVDVDVNGSKLQAFDFGLLDDERVADSILRMPEERAPRTVEGEAAPQVPAMLPQADGVTVYLLKQIPGSPIQKYAMAIDEAIRSGRGADSVPVPSNVGAKKADQIRRKIEPYYPSAEAAPPAEGILAAPPAPRFTPEEVRAAIGEAAPAPVPEAGRTVPPVAPAPVTIQPTGTTTALGIDPAKSYDFRFRVVDLDELIPSNLDTLEINPAYPKELQPRDRARTASELQIDRIARELNPDALLIDTHRLDSGPMIVGADNIVESGNGRVLALRRAKNLYPEQYAAYIEQLRSQLAQYGLTDADLAGKTNPVLVRERVTDVDRAAFAAEANQAVAMRLAPFEQALQDAGNVRDDLLAGLEIGETQSIDEALNSTPNRPLVRAFIDALPETERAALLDAQGNLNRAGLDRLRSALFAKTYTGEAGERLLAIFAESIEPEIKTLENAMYASLPAMAQAEGAIRAGLRDANLSIAGDLTAAIDAYRRLKSNGISITDYLSQLTLGARELDPFREALLRYIGENARSIKNTRDVLREYARLVMAQEPPGQMTMFGGIRASKAELLQNAINTVKPEALPLFPTGEQFVVPGGGVPELTTLPPAGAELAGGAAGIPAAAGGAGGGGEGVGRLQPAELPAAPAPRTDIGDIARLAEQYGVATATEAGVPTPVILRIVQKYIRGGYGEAHPDIPVQRDITQYDLNTIQDALDARAQFNRTTQGTGNAVGPYPAGALESLGMPEYRSVATAELWQSQVKPILEGLEEELLSGSPPSKLRNVDLDSVPGLRQALNGYLKQVDGDMASTKLTGTRWAENLRDQALINYSKQRGFDKILNIVLPYQYWYTRSMWQWAQRMIDRPKWFANYARLRNYGMNNLKLPGYPSRLANKFAVPAPYLPEWAGDQVFVDPLRQIFYPEQFFNPIDQYASNYNEQENRAVSVLQRWVSEGKMTPYTAAEAMRSREGQSWDMAMAEAKRAMDQAEPSNFDFLNLISGPALYLTLPAYLATGKDIITGRDDISLLPITRTGRSLKEITKNTPLHALGQALGGIMSWPEETWRKKRGLSEFGDWGNYYVDRMIANMAGSGEITTREAQTAMIERRGPAYEEAVNRVRLESALRVPGALPIYAALHGAAPWNDPAEFAGAVASGWLPANLYPPGEMEQRNLGVLYNLARNQYNAGDETAVNDFLTENPEYEARMALYDEPAERLRQFLISEVWDRYTALPGVDKKKVQQDLGNSFQTDFLNTETHNYDLLDTETLAYWARYMGGQVPVTGETQAIAEAPDILVDKLQQAPPDEAMIVETYRNLRNQLFPNWYAAQNLYYSTPEGKRIIPGASAQESKVIATYRDERSARFPDWFDLQERYFGLPEGQRRGFLASNPQLGAYWDWSRQQKKLHPEISKYKGVESQEVGGRAEILAQFPWLKDYWDWNRQYKQQYPVIEKYTQQNPEGNFSLPYDFSFTEDFTPPLTRQLLGYYRGSQPLTSGAISELRYVWEHNGRPGESFDVFINEILPMAVAP